MKKSRYKFSSQKVNYWIYFFFYNMHNVYSLPPKKLEFLILRYFHCQYRIYRCTEKKKEYMHYNWSILLGKIGKILRIITEGELKMYCPKNFLECENGHWLVTTCQNRDVNHQLAKVSGNQWSPSL